MKMVNSPEQRNAIANQTANRYAFLRSRSLRAVVRQCGETKEHGNWQSFDGDEVNFKLCTCELFYDAHSTEQGKGVGTILFCSCEF